MLMRAEKKIEELSENPDLVKYIDDEKAMEFGHKQDVEEASAIAYEKGHTSGFEEGRTSGFEEGRTSGFEDGKIEIAKKLLNMDLPLKQIQKATGLSKEQIDNL